MTHPFTHVHTSPLFLERKDYVAASSYKTSNHRCLRTVVQALGTCLSNGLKQLATENLELRTLTEHATHDEHIEATQGGVYDV